MTKVARNGSAAVLACYEHIVIAVHVRHGVLITGSAGTGKSILAGAFAEAACLRKEHTLYVSFYENPSEVVRDLSSVGIRLGSCPEAGVSTYSTNLT
jgi:KaiC/GvpD/RAD55 family RecA-like ATPase